MMRRDAADTVSIPFPRTKINLEGREGAAVSADVRQDICLLWKGRVISVKILVINAGSSSLKYQLIDMDGEAVVAKGNCERIGIDGKITHKTGDGRQVVK